MRPAPPPDVFRWYCVRTDYLQERLVDRELREGGWDVFAPTIFRPARLARRDATGVVRPGRDARVDYLFPRYLMVSLNLTDPAWHAVRRTPGVERIISGGHSSNNGIGIPIALPDKALDWVRALPGFTENGCIYPASFHHTPIAAGAVVRVLEGPMADLAGICAWSDGRRIMVLMELLGRSVRVSMAQSGVEAA